MSVRIYNVGLSLSVHTPRALMRFYSAVMPNGGYVRVEHTDRPDCIGDWFPNPATRFFYEKATTVTPSCGVSGIPVPYEARFRYVSLVSQEDAQTQAEALALERATLLAHCRRRLATTITFTFANPVTNGFRLYADKVQFYEIGAADPSWQTLWPGGGSSIEVPCSLHPGTVVDVYAISSLAGNVVSSDWSASIGYEIGDPVAKTGGAVATMAVAVPGSITELEMGAMRIAD